MSRAPQRRASAPPVIGSRTILYAASGLLLGACLTVGGYLVDYHALYGELPSSLSIGVWRGLHAVTPVHYFADLFALILAVIGGLAGWLQDRVIFYSSRLEELVEIRTQDLRRSEERYALVVEGSSHGIWDWDLCTNEVYYSPRWKRMIGCRSEDVPGTLETWLDRVQAGDDELVRDRLQAHLEGATSHFEVDYRMRHADGSYRWMLARGATIRDRSGRPIRMAGSQTDVHDRRMAEDQLRHLALYDRLTGLPNRTLLYDRLTRILQQARRQKTNVALLYIGIDRFKKINESLGPVVGDQLLAREAARLAEVVAEFDSGAALETGNREPAGSVFKAEGDEFVVVLEDIRSFRDATRLANQVLKAHEHPNDIEGRDVLLNISIGVMRGPGEYQKADAFLRDAQTAMNRAKALGRARFEVFDRDSLDSAEESMHLETELYQALEERQLQLWYQPVCAIATGKIVGFEALARWEHPDRGMIMPGRFIPFAEETGMIVRLSRQLFQDVFRLLGSWQERFGRRRDLAININLSPKYLLHPELQQDFGQLLRETGADPSRVHLEITETSFIDNPDTVTTVLKDLKRWGFKIALDDFGTGFSSLSMLHSLPFDILKIDRRFVSRLCEDDDVRQIVGTIITLGRKLGLDIVAEGIETEEQHQQLRSMRCKYGQGFLLGRPMDADAAEELLRSKSNTSQKCKVAAS